MKKITLGLTIGFASMLSLTSCQSDVLYSSDCWDKNDSTTYADTYTKYFNTSITVKLCSDTMDKSEYDTIFTQVENIIEKYDQVTSKRVDYEDIVNVKTINDDPTNTHILSDELFEILQFSLDYYETSDGRFNIALDPVVSLWEEPLGNFNTDEYKLEVFKPTDNAINNALVNTDASKINLDSTNNSITMEQGMSLNLGGIAKGYMVDILYDYLESNDDVSSFSINAGGSSIRFGGYNPNSERDHWSVAIQNPFGFDVWEPNIYCSLPSATSDTDCYYQSIKLNSGQVIATSGDYQKYFYDYNDLINNGMEATKYHHIIDPFTGYPVVTTVKSVSVITNQSKVADIESTNLYIMSLEDGLEYVNNNDSIEAIWYLSDNTVVKSNNFSRYE